MGTRKSARSKRANSTGVTGNTGDAPLANSDINSISDNDTPQKAGEMLRAHAGRPRRNQHVPVEINDEYLRDLPKMNFALLLAILMRQGGHVALKQRDIERANDETHSILFALSPDGLELEVRVVSNESGIIRSPEATTQWAPASAPALPATIPQFMPPAPEVDLRDQAQAIVTQWRQQTQGGAAAETDQTAQFIAAAGGGDQAPRITEVRKTPENVFPFQVGTSPTTAAQVSLSELQNRLLSKDQAIAQQELAAAARVDSA